MTAKKIKSIGERGFLARLLPTLQKKAARSCWVPPGDDAAVLRTPSRPVLSIDGLTEGTHFLWSWRRRCEQQYKISFGRALGWKLMGSALSDLAAMGSVNRRWAMVYLAAPADLDLRFLSDFQRGVQETAEKYSCVLAGGDTVRAKDLSLVAAVGGELKGRQALVRTGAREGDLLAIAGTVGDAGEGLRLLMRKSAKKRPSDSYFVRRFFQHEPLFSVGDLLGKTTGVTSLMDLSDSLPETLELLMKASHCGAAVEITKTPISAVYTGQSTAQHAFAHSGEDYSLLFTASPKAIQSLSKKIPLSVIGRIGPHQEGLQLFSDGRRIENPKGFQQFT